MEEKDKGGIYRREIEQKEGRRERAKRLEGSQMNEELNRVEEEMGRERRKGKKEKDRRSLNMKKREREKERRKYQG